MQFEDGNRFCHIAVTRRQKFRDQAAERANDQDKNFTQNMIKEADEAEGHEIESHEVATLKASIVF